jgi:hypothetical protein
MQAAAVRGHPHVADGPVTTGAWESRTIPDPRNVARVTPATLAGGTHLGWMHNLISIPSLKSHMSIGVKSNPSPSQLQDLPLLRLPHPNVKKGSHLGVTSRRKICNGLR